MSNINNESTVAGIFYGLLIAYAGYHAYQKLFTSEKTLSEQTVSPPKRPTDDIFITELESKSVWTLDVKTVKGPPNKRLGWVVANHEENKETEYRETKELWSVNCATTAYQILSEVRYFPNGEPDPVLNSDSKNIEIWYPAPATNAAAVVDVLCDERFG